MMNDFLRNNPFAEAAFKLGDDLGIRDKDAYAGADGAELPGNFADHVIYQIGCGDCGHPLEADDDQCPGCGKTTDFENAIDVS